MNFINPSKVIRVDPIHPDLSKLREPIAALQEGKVVIFPTDTVYGIGVDGLNPSAVKNLYHIKGRSKEKPIILLIADTQDVDKFARVVTPLAKELIEKYWPGQVTIILEAKEEIPAIVRGDGSTVGFRMPDSPVALAIIKGLGRPVATSSANRAGGIPPANISEIDSELMEKVEFIVDTGKEKSTIPSTVVDLSGPEPIIVRRGEVEINVTVQVV